MKPSSPQPGPRASRLRSAFFAIVLLAFASGMPARAQGILDPSFAAPADWLSPARVSALGVQPDGRIVVAGYFYSTQNVRVMRLNLDGSEDTSFARVRTDEDPKFVLIQPDGKILIGAQQNGALANVNGHDVMNLARLNADGTLDQTFQGPWIDFDGNNIRGLALQPDGKLLIAGSFNSVSDQPQKCIARLNPDGSLDPTLVSPFPSGLFCPEYIALRADGKIYASGSFPFPANSSPRSTLVRLNPDGSLDANLSQTVGFDGAVRTLSALPDGRLLVGGSDGGGRVIRLNADDTRDTSFDVRFYHSAGPAIVNGLFAQPDGKVVVSGTFVAAGDQPRPGIARINADGTIDGTFALPEQGVDLPVFAMASAQADGKILILGSFTQIEGAPREGLARLRVPETTTQRLSINAAHNGVRWQRSGAGMQLAQVKFESSTDGQAWTPLGSATWNLDAWELGGLSLPAQSNLWLRAAGVASSGAAQIGAGINSSVIGASRQVVATVSPSAGAGGSISPSVAQYVDAGSTAQFTITPAAGQQILFVGGSCGGTRVGNVFTTNAVEADCTVLAQFVDAAAIVVSPYAAAGGTISPAQPQAAQAGTALTFTITPDAGHAIAGVGGSCGGQLSGHAYTTAPLQANCSVEASFVLTTATVTASATGGHGSIGPASQTLNYGEVATLTVTSDPGYNAIVSGCGGTLSGSVYRTAPLTGDCAVTAQFSAYADAGTSMTLRLSLDPQNVCSVGTPSIEVQFGQDVWICANLHNGTGRRLRPMTIWRGPAAGDLNAVRPDFIQINGMNAGASWANGYFAPISARASGDVTVTWSGLADPGTGGSDNALVPTYVHDEQAAFVPIDLSSSPQATDLGLIHPGTYAMVRMPFKFNFYGIPTDILCVSNDGALVPANEICNTWGDGSGSLQAAVALRSTIDYTTGYEGGAVRSAVIGAAPNRRFVVEWRDKRILGAGSGGVTFQALIDEADSAITYQYVSMTVGDASVDNGQGAQAGLLLESHRLRNDYPSGATLTDGKTIRWTPSTQPFTALTSASAHITVLAPELEVQPASIGAQAAPGASATATLTLGNLGNVAAQWEALAAAGDGRGFEIGSAFEPTSVRAPSQAATTVRRAPPPAHAQSGGVDGSASVPAFAHAWESQNNSRLVSFAAGSPPSAAPAHFSVNLWAVMAGGFVDDDFSQLYLMQSAGASDDASWMGELQRLDPHSFGAGRSILRGVGTAPLGGGAWRGLRWDARTNTLFGVASNYGAAVPPPFHTDLYRIDPVTGWSTRLARLDSVSSDGTALADIAIDNHGNLYGIDMGTDTLIAIDKVSGHVRPIGPTGLNVGYYNLQSMDFDHSTGTLYYATWTEASAVGAQMFTVDTATGATTLVGTIGDGRSGLRALSIAKPASICVDAAQVPWLSLDRDQGTVDAASAQTVTLSFDAQGLAVGTYRANLCIGNDTPYRSQITVPVTLTVATDGIFADGFEAR